MHSYNHITTYWVILIDYSAFKPLELSDKTIFENYLQAHPPSTSELTFTNQFIWRKTYAPHWAVIAGCLCIVSKPQTEDEFFFPPVGDNPIGAIKELIGMVQQENRPIRFERVSESLTLSVQESGDVPLTVEYSRDQSDYIYGIDDLVSLSGNKLKDKRKKFNRFLQKYPQHDYKTCQTILVEDCMKIQEKWYNSMAINGDTSLEAEHVAVQEAFDHHDELGFDGGVIFVEGNPVAFTLGEALNPDTVVIHIEKADIEYEGSYQAINQMFLERGESVQGKKFVNREQDLGVPGLRRAKKSYAPIQLVKKYRMISPE